MRWIAVHFFVILSGCGVDQEPPCGGYGCHTTYTSEATGVRTRYDVASRNSEGATVYYYTETAACTGLSGPGPIVLFVSDAAYNVGGRYLYNDNAVIIYDGTDAMLLQHLIIKHEFVHHLLEINGFPRDRNSSHDSPLFEQCS